MEVTCSGNGAMTHRVFNDRLRAIDTARDTGPPFATALRLLASRLRCAGHPFLLGLH